jgi:hypothetical protein
MTLGRASAPTQVRYSDDRLRYHAVKDRPVMGSVQRVDAGAPSPRRDACGVGAAGADAFVNQLRPRGRKRGIVKSALPTRRANASSRSDRVRRGGARMKAFVR